MTIFLLLLASYVFGAIPIGLLVGKMVRGIDVREFGSGNIGASNVWRTLGPAWGIFVFLLDVVKGLTPVLLARHAFPGSAWTIVGAGIAAILGHNFSPFLKFKGGKGVATSLGVAFALSWQAGLIAFASWGVVLLLTRFISVSSMVGVAVGSFFIWQFNDRQIPFGLFGLLATVFGIVKHKANIQRLKNGTEPKVGKKK